MNATCEQGVLPVLFIDAAQANSFASEPRRGSKAAPGAKLGDKERNSMSQILSAQPSTATDKRAVSQTVLNAYSKKAGFGPLSKMLQAYNS